MPHLYVWRDAARTAPQTYSPSTLRHIHTQAHTPIQYVHAHTKMLACACTRLCTQTHVHAHMHTRTHTRTHTYTHAHIHASPHTHIHTHTHSWRRFAQHVTWIPNAKFATACALTTPLKEFRSLARVRVCCSMWQRLAVCCSVLQCVAICYDLRSYSTSQGIQRHLYCNTMQHTATRGIQISCEGQCVLQSVAVGCSLLQCVLQSTAVGCNMMQ